MPFLLKCRNFQVSRKENEIGSFVLGKTIAIVYSLFLILSYIVERFVKLKNVDQEEFGLRLFLHNCKHWHLHPRN